MPKAVSTFFAPSSVSVTAFFFSSISKWTPLRMVRTTASTRSYSSVLFSPWPEMISGVRASSMRMESTSSTMAKAWPRCTRSPRRITILSRR